MLCCGTIGPISGRSQDQLSVLKPDIIEPALSSTIWLGNCISWEWFKIATESFFLCISTRPLDRSVFRGGGINRNSCWPQYAHHVTSRYILHIRLNIFSIEKFFIKKIICYFLSFFQVVNTSFWNSHPPILGSLFCGTTLQPCDHVIT